MHRARSLLRLSVMKTIKPPIITEFVRILIDVAASGEPRPYIEISMRFRPRYFQVLMREFIKAGVVESVRRPVPGGVLVAVPPSGNVFLKDLLAFLRRPNDPANDLLRRSMGGEVLLPQVLADQPKKQELDAGKEE